MIDKLLSRSLRGQLAITGGAIILALVVGAVVMIADQPHHHRQLDVWLWVDAYLALIQGATGIAITLDPFSIEFLGLNGVIDTLVRATPVHPRPAWRSASASRPASSTSARRASS